MRWIKSGAFETPPFLFADFVREKQDLALNVIAEFDRILFRARVVVFCDLRIGRVDTLHLSSCTRAGDLGASFGTLGT